MPSTSPSTFAKRSRRFLAQELENVWLLPKHRLINLFEFSCQSKNSNLIAGFFLSKHRCKLINLNLPGKTQNWLIVWFYHAVIQNEFSMNLCFDKRNQSGQHLQVTFFSYFFQIKFTFWHEIHKIDFDFAFWQIKACFIYFTSEISVMGRTEIFVMECTDRNFWRIVDLNLCFD